MITRATHLWSNSLKRYLNWINQRFKRFERFLWHMAGVRKYPTISWLTSYRFSHLDPLLLRFCKWKHRFINRFVFVELFRNAIHLQTYKSRIRKNGFNPLWTHVMKVTFFRAFHRKQKTELNESTVRRIRPQSSVELSPEDCPFTGNECRVCFPWDCAQRKRFADYSNWIITESQNLRIFECH